MNIEFTEKKDKRSGLVTSRTAELTPKGFALGRVTVSMREHYVPETMAIVPVVDISWGCGWRDGTISSLDVVRLYIRALEKAIEIAEAWEREFKSRKR